MEFSVENLCGLLIRSKLVTADEVRMLYQRWLTDARGAAANSDQYLKWLVANHMITSYQAALIARGMPDNFFLNEYKILDRIGQGCMAGVYKATHQLGTTVAIKVLPPSKAKNQQLFARFQREARLALRLKHPNVVRTFQVGEADGLNYLVMEHLEGETLKEVLNRRGRLPPPEGARIVHQALLGMQHFHELGLVHRDLKPANLMLVPKPGPGQPDVTTGATVKILDIGLVRALNDDDVSDGTDNQQLTGEGMMLGTPDYMAPEQARDAHKADIRADIYALGCVLYHVLAGQPPFPDKSLINQMVRHIKETPRPLMEFNREVPEGLNQVVNYMMAKDPAQRYPTPERAAQALQVFLVGGAEGPQRLEAEPQMRPYLSWLEARDGGPVSSAKLASTAAAVTVPAAPSKPAKPPSSDRVPKSAAEPARAPETVTGLKSRDKAQKLKKQKPGAPDTGEMKAAAELGEFDVELVPAPFAETVFTLPFKEIAISRRDLIMLGIGAGGVILAGVLGMGVAGLRKKKPPTPPPEDDAANSEKEEK